MDKARKVCRGIFWSVAIAWVLGSSTGCTRMFYRRQADNEVNAILREKDIFPEWKIENMQAYPDPRARFADPTNPDRPPMPPDDPAAKMLGPNPQRPRHAGVARVEGTGYLDLLAMWDAQNREERSALSRLQAEASMTESIRNVAHRQQQEERPEVLPPPRPFDAVPVVKTNPYLIRIDQAMELGLINSREFQSRREDLYLTVLPVTRERFGFAPQWLAIGQAVRERTGVLVPTETGGNGWQFASQVGVSKLFTTGALLLAAFANETAVNFGNPALPRTTSTSTFNLDILQPLLRGGGKAVTLEPLTLAERNLLYQIRAYARFRKEYYQFLIGGANLPNPPGSVTSPGSLAGANLLLGTLSGGNPARQQIGPSGSGTLFLGTNASAPAEGYLPSLFKNSILRYEYANIEALEKVLKLFDAYQEGGQVSPLQVDQVRLQLLQGRSNVLNKELDRDTSLDNFKFQLGLPLHTPLELEDQPVRGITGHLARYDQLLDDYAATIKLVEDLYLAAPDKVRAGLVAIVKSSQLTKATAAFSGSLPKTMKEWEGLTDEAILKRLTEKGEEKRKLLDAKASSLKEGRPLTDVELRKLRENETDVAVGRMEQALRVYQKAPWEKEAKAADKQRVRTIYWRTLREPFVSILEDANAERFKTLGKLWPELPTVVVDGVDLVKSEIHQSYEIVTKVALDNRLDLMNTRAQVVDSWRQLRVFANGLLGVFNLAYHMDSSTPPGAATPLAFQNSRTRHQLVMNFDIPLVRLTERNAYRASLIAYQRSRRDLDQKEDEIAGQVRSDIRQLQVLEKNFRIQQQAVELAYQQVENSLETFRSPQVPDNSPNAAASAAANAAALTNQLLQAYNRLPQAQQQVLKTWIDYQIARQQLFLDLELMPLDARGVWLDELTRDPTDRSPSGDLERNPGDAGPDLGVAVEPRTARREARPVPR